MRRAWAAAVMAVVSLLVAAPSRAQGYPDRPIRVLLPLAAGSAVDVMARIVGDRMGEILGQRLVIENQPGASGMIGARNAARAAPDGYTIVAVNDSILTMLPNMSTTAGYDPLRDFEPVVQMARIQWALVAHPSFPPSDLKGLVEYARAQPGGVDYASGGPGSPHHVAMEMFMQMTGTRMNHIPYRGATPALNDIVSGKVPVGFTAFPTPNQFISGGLLKLLAAAGTARYAAFPDAPTVAEAGVPDFSFYTWGALLAPARTPPAVVARLNAAAVEALATPAVRTRLEGLGFEVVGNAPTAFAAALRDDHARMGQLIRSAGITMD